MSYIRQNNNQGTIYTPTEGLRVTDKSIINTDGKQFMLRIPNKIAEQLEIKVGDEFVFEITMLSGRVIETRIKIEKGKSRQTIKEVVEKRKKKAHLRGEASDGT